MIDIAIIGAGGFGREVKTLIDQINKVEQNYKLIGFFDDDVANSNNINGLPYLGIVKKLEEVKTPLALAIGVGNPQFKREIVDNINNKLITFPTLIHPNAIISDDNVKIGIGTIICAGTILTCDISLGSFITLNLNCTVGHDTKIGEYCSFMPAVNVSGEVVIEDNVYIGTGAKIINQLSIGQNTIIGAGAVVSKSLPPDCTAVGIPAKPIKFHK